MKKEPSKLIARPAHHYVLLLILALSTALFIVGLYVFIYAQIDELTTRSLSVKEVVSTRKFDQARAHEVRRVYDATSADRAAVKTLFVSSTDIVPFIEEVEAIGSSTGSVVAVSSIRSDDLASAEAGTVGTLQAHIDAHGSWQSVMRALSVAENMKYAVSVSNVRMFSSREAVGNKTQVSWSLSFDLQALLIAVPHAASVTGQGAQP